MNFNVKITNTTGKTIQVGAFNLIAYDEDGDELERIETEQSTDTGSFRLKVDELLPGKAVAFSPTMSSQNFPRLKTLAMVWGKNATHTTRP